MSDEQAGPTDPFLTVRDAAQVYDVPVRTLYNAIDRKTLRTRTGSDAKRTLLVHGEDVRRLAEERAASANASTVQGADWHAVGNHAGKAPASTDVAAARDRVELRRLEALEHRATEDARRAASEAIQADAEREHRRQAAALAVERERLALERDAARAEEERAEAAARLRREESARREAAAEQERRAAAQAAQAHEAKLRVSWESGVLRKVDRRVLEELGRPDLIPDARAVAKLVLRGLDRHDPDEFVTTVLDGALRRDLADAYAAHDLREQRSVAAHLAAKVAKTYDRAEVALAVQDAALSAAKRERVPIDEAARARIVRSACEAREAALDEVFAREQRQQVDAMVRLAATLKDFWPM